MSQGYEIRELDNLATIPKAFFQHKDGRVVELPADPRNLNYYLRKGLIRVDKPLNLKGGLI
ncbi:hypothetical protein LCGC14_0396720 [marine sediment metagenome]|uniref:Uncharacterized protein n=1 Tax=marine sediment metagenome TaxID=412755 RepID=A0A0F9SY81_9ZZZZ